MNDKVTINAEFDLALIRDTVEAATRIEDDQEVFEQLAGIQQVKKQLAELDDLVKSVEAEAKSAIKSKAKALYGDDWQAIEGDNFKITRSATGSVYSIVGKPGRKFVKVKESVDTDAVEEHMLAHDGQLPSGIEVNPSRGESIRISMKASDEDGQA